MRTRLSSAVALASLLALLLSGCPDSPPSEEGSSGDAVGDVTGIDPVDGVTPGQPDASCVPDCAGKACGGDGCGGSCGGCAEGKCVDGQCKKEGCTPSCAGKQCGADGCGGSCGSCFEGWTCKDGVCVDPGGPLPCGDGACASDESCTSCPADCGACGSVSCTDAVACLLGCYGDTNCIDACLKPATEVVADAAQALVECIADACSGDSAPGCEHAVTQPHGPCGELAAACEATCAPSCNGKECGEDGCGGSCGECLEGSFCNDGTCKPPGFASCEDLLLCALNCPQTEPGCAKSCAEGGSPNAQNAFIKLVSCLQQVCNGLEPECVQKALADTCAVPYEGCVGTCTPFCDGKQCGPDGCGGSCGSCGPNGTCVQGACQGGCQTGATQCVGGGVSQCIQGTWSAPKPCPTGQSCKDGVCQGGCQPGATQCTNGGVSTCVQGAWSAPKPCPSGQSCKDGACQGGCTPKCAGKQCGGDGCGGSCGTCPQGAACSNGLCVQPGCIPGQSICDGSTVLACGADGTWVPIQKCPANTMCQNGQCVGAGKSCADIVECAFACSSGSLECIMMCQEGATDAAAQSFNVLVSCVLNWCDATNPMCFQQVITNQCAKQFDACMGGCVPSCAGKQCGADGCGGICGECKQGTSCSNGQCIPTTQCTPGQTICQGNTVLGCSASGAWTPVQQCPADTPCVAGKCQGGCVPSCAGKQCGSNGCGGSCGTCPDGLTCSAGQCTQISTGTCSDIVTCGAGCGLNDKACVQKCVSLGGQEAQGLYSKLLECVGSVCGQGTPIHPQAPCSLTAMQGPCADIAKVCQTQQGCVPQCGNKVCGGDGCGGSCGTCQPGTACSGGQCIATPNCVEGAQICEGSTILLCVNGNWMKVETCPPGTQCQSGKCAPVGQCADGEIGCANNAVAWCIGGQWLPIQQCAPSEKCLDGACIGSCIPSCAGKQCGGDGCGGSCGQCGPLQQCTQGKCIAVTGTASCSQVLECALSSCAPSDTACLTKCGQTGTQQAQSQFQAVVGCVAQYCGFGITSDCAAQAMAGPCAQQVALCKGGTCTPQCAGKTCGPNGCGGSCGTCPAGQSCSSAGTCSGKPPMGCYAMLVCMSDCPTDDCAYQCFYDSTPEAQSMYIELSDCLLAACGPNGDPACYEKAATGACQKSYFGCLSN
ncbi:MAG: hypothetical protein AMXMBFR64_38620 [Myxococcales bacterium]